MALPAAGQPISFKDINDELGNSSQATLDLKSASEALGESTAPFGMDELAGISNDSPAFTTALTATADSVDPSKVVLAWAVGVPTGAPAISAFTLKRATDSNISANVSTLSTNAAGSPVNDTGLAGGTQFFYRASATNAIGTTVSNDNATTTTARTAIAIKYLRQEEQGESNVFTGWISTAGSVASTKGELVLCAEGAVVADDSRGSGISTVLLSENEAIADGTLSNGDTLFAATTGTSVSAKKPNDDLVNQETFLVETTQNNIFQINTSGVLSNVRSRTPNQPSQPTLNADSSTQITVTIPSTNTAVTRELKLQRSINGGSFSDKATFVPSDSGSIDDTSISTTFVDDSGISAGDVVKYQVRGQNAFANSAFSTESATVTTPSAGTAWSNLSGDPQNLLGAEGGQEESNAASIDLANGSGDTVIGLATAGGIVGTLQIAYSTSGDPGLGGTANGGSGFGNSSSHRTINNSTYSSGTLHFRVRFTHNTGKDGTGSYTVTFTNNSVSNGDFNGNLTFGL
tara:strand:+ start:162 stop:1715 length:1554 start_codon:yes stop_codon:yes gene_type:complete